MATQPDHPTHPSQPGQPSYGWEPPPPYNPNPPPYELPSAAPEQPQNNPQSPRTTPEQPSATNNMYAGGADYESGGLIDEDAFSFSEKSIRMAFVRKVYAILMVQLAVTVGLISLFVYEPNVKSYSRQHPEMCWIALAVTISEDVLIAAGICTAVCLALTIFAMQTKWDFTACGGILFVCVIVLFIFGIVAICIPGKVIRLVYASLGALLFSVYLVFDTQMMLGGNHKYSISPEEYIFAALNLYLDIINIFLYILALVGGSLPYCIPLNSSLGSGGTRYGDLKGAKSALPTDVWPNG
ncbi:hypothetical protein DAPPUDRAFT_265831 [Daphnia pulex]|uniref:Uncharacterized protein n=1 Tax=Daphnia pulex TaxID=6669 RepID=E9HU24_DAPPU|nr:hypothetical protein DAPPUDRAFT_265831 [Daphnia pulex]|eukprot:EFX64759.1 hypothetical protein DAPPUDRAFT_265831 [Daphnia pulex]